MRWTSTQSCGAALEAGDALADVVVEDFGAAAGDGVEAGIAKAGDGGREVELAVLGDVRVISDAERQCSQIFGKRCLMPREEVLRTSRS